MEEIFTDKLMQASEQRVNKIQDLFKNGILQDLGQTE